MTGPTVQTAILDFTVEIFDPDPDPACSSVMLNIDSAIINSTIGYNIGDDALTVNLDSIYVTTICEDSNNESTNVNGIGCDWFYSYPE